MSFSANRFEQLYSGDIELLAKLAERIHQVSSNESFLNHSYSVLSDALPRKYFNIDSYSVNPVSFERAVNMEFPNEMYVSYKKYVHQHPFVKHFMTPSGVGRVLTILKVTSSAEFHKTDLYRHFYKLQGVEDQLAFVLLHPGGAYVVAYSRDTAFTDREQLLMELLKPQLQIALKNWLRICELEKHLRTLEQKSTVFEQACCAGRFTERLSPRQRAVAEQVALGFDNRQIARRLHISSKTVEKHLENIFRILGIHNRTALVAMWLRSTD